MEEYTPEEVVESAFARTQVTADPAFPGSAENREEKSWEVIRDECDSGGAMDARCNIVAASMGVGKLDVVAKRLACGCLMVALDDIERLDWDIAGE